MNVGRNVEGAVSLWVGTAESEGALEAYADCDAPRHPARTLAGDFGTGRYDHDFMEIGIESPTQSLTELLRGCSYEGIVVPKFIDLLGDVLTQEVNAFVLLYNFHYHGAPSPSVSSALGPVTLRYLGSIKVDTPWPG